MSRRKTFIYIFVYICPLKITLSLRKLGLTSLLFILLMQSAGLWWIYKIQQCQVRIEMSGLIRNQQNGFLHLSLSISEYRLARISSGEISLKAELYDIKSVSFVADRVEILVLKDSREKEILEKSGSLSQNTQKRQSEFPGQLIRLLSLDYLAPFTDSKTTILNPETITYIPLSEQTRSFPGKISSPPPESV